MFSVRHLSYQDSEAIVHMEQYAVHPTEHQYSYNATEILMIGNINAKLSKSMIVALWSSKLPSPKLP